jgi:fucose permease
MNWLHASYGLGVTVGPVIMTAALNLTQSWRWGYAVVVLALGLLATCFGLTSDRWRSPASENENENGNESRNEPASPKANPGSPASKASSIDTLKLPIVWLGITIFIMHPGVQFTAAQWAYSLFTEARSVTPSTAGLWISIYWGSLTAGRLVLGTVADHFGVDSLLRTCILGIILGSVLIWWNIADPLSFLGLVLIGFTLAPLYPSLMSGTPKRVGAAHAANTIGFQAAAASIGVALLPGVAGVLAELLGLEVIGPFLVAASIVLFVLHEVIVRYRS